MKREASTGLMLLFIAEWIILASIILSGFILVGTTGMVAVIVSAGCEVAAFILYFTGLTIAGEDDTGFRNARGVMIGVFVAQMIIIILNALNLAGNETAICNLFVIIFVLIMMVMIFDAMRRLCEGNSGLYQFLSVSRAIYIVVVIIELAANFFAYLVPGSTAIVAALVIVALILAVVSKIFVLISYSSASSYLKSAE